MVSFVCLFVFVFVVVVVVAAGVVVYFNPSVFASDSCVTLVGLFWNEDINSCFLAFVVLVDI